MFLFWGGECNGYYSVKSAYRYCVGEWDAVINNEWIVMWNFAIPPKIKCLF